MIRAVDTFAVALHNQFEIECVSKTSNFELWKRLSLTLQYILDILKTAMEMSISNEFLID